ncbi:hypothetical protein ACLOJK_010526 [Asimina triloba]
MSISYVGKIVASPFASRKSSSLSISLDFENKTVGHLLRLHTENKTQISPDTVFLNRSWATTFLDDEKYISFRWVFARLDHGNRGQCRSRQYRCAYDSFAVNELADFPVERSTLAKSKTLCHGSAMAKYANWVFLPSLLQFTILASKFNRCDGSEVEPDFGDNALQALLALVENGVPPPTRSRRGSRSSRGRQPTGSRRRPPHGVFDVVSSIHFLHSTTTDTHEFAVADVGNADAATTVDQVEGAVGEEEEEVSNVGVVVELADYLGEHGLTELAFLGLATCLGEPAGVASKFIPDADTVHHVIPVEQGIEGVGTELMEKMDWELGLSECGSSVDKLTEKMSSCPVEMDQQNGSRKIAVAHESGVDEFAVYHGER